MRWAYVVLLSLFLSPLQGELPSKVVVIMFENHSFDNLLGYLWEDVPNKANYEGVVGKNLSNPVPDFLQAVVGNTTIPVYKGTIYDFPYLGLTPGEEYPYVNTDLYNQLDPQNANIPGTATTAPYNVPAVVPNPPPMSGFILSYFNALNGTKLSDNQKLPQSKVMDPKNFGAIMTALPNSEIPVMTTLARNGAVFDHWFSDVPSQTYCNRDFFHSATSRGKVLNHFPSAKDLLSDSDQKTIFQQLSDHGITWKVYFPGFISITLLLHFASLHKFYKNFHNMDTFYQDLKDGTLPQYSFVEPEFLGAPADYHPTDGSNIITNHSSILAGEIYLKEVYDGIRTSSSVDQILFVVTFDESGGTYDHVPPPTVITPPDGSGKQEMDFMFDRLGMRVPMIWMSSYIQPNTTVNDVLQHTSFIRFLRSLFNLPDEPLTNRDRDAPNIQYNSLFGSTKREWPTVTARNDTNPGSSDDDIDEMSYFVSIAQSVFKQYLKDLACDVSTWLSKHCENDADQGMSAAIKGAIAAGVIGGVIIIVCIWYFCCKRNNGALWLSCKLKCCSPSGMTKANEVAG